MKHWKATKKLFEKHEELWAYLYIIYVIIFMLLWSPENTRQMDAFGFQMVKFIDINMMSVILWVVIHGSTMIYKEAREIITDYKRLLKDIE